MNATRLLVVVMMAALVPGTWACASGGGGRRSSTATANLDDATIATRVKTALLNEPDLSALQIQVQAADGVVTLEGAVETKPEEARALAVARSVGGVRDVRSALKVKSGA